jgi:flagellar L-ring protein precursor FlgH
MRVALLVAALALAGCEQLRRRPPLPPPPQMAATFPDAPGMGSLWHPELTNNYAFIDVVAHFPGDLLTVVVAEAAQGQKNATTDTSAASSISASVEDFFGIPASAVKALPSGFNPASIVKAEAARASKGDGLTKRADTLTASITVRVQTVDPNGNLHVQGDKLVRVNRENQHIVLSGTVRPVDIATDNSVLSTRLADARIDYYGVGTVGDKQGTPLVHRLYDWIWPF